MLGYDIGHWILVVIFVAVIATVRVVRKNMTTGQCAACGEPVRLKLVNVSPSGENNLRIKRVQVRYHCENCGRVSVSYK